MSTEKRKARVPASRLPAIGAACALASFAAQAGDPITVCVKADGALYIPYEVTRCAPGEERKLFAEWEPEEAESEEDEPAKEEVASEKEDGTNKDQMQQQLASLENRLQQLSSRIASLEQDKSAPARSQTPSPPRSVASRVKAPFEVVDDAGTVILRVASRVASKDGQGARVTIGGGNFGNYALRVHRDGGAFVAGIGEAQDGSGIMLVNDSSGETSIAADGKLRSISVYGGDRGLAARLIAEPTRGGLIAVYHGETPVAYLNRSSGGDGGNVTVALNNGFGVFSAGAAQDGAGEACVNRRTQAGTPRLACLGLGLPSMGMGK